MEDSNTKEVKSKRGSFVERYKLSHPGDEFDDNDDEALFDRISKGQEDSASKLGEYEKESKKLTDLFSSDPRAAGMFSSWKEGGNPIDYLLENFGDEFKEALDDTEKKEQFSRSYQKWLDKVANDGKMKQECDDNLQATFKILEDLQAKNGWSDEESLNVFNCVHDMIMDGIYNKITPETFSMAAKALHYDKDVKEAAMIGEKKGRNTKIEEKLQQEKAPEGVAPTLGGGNGGAPEQKKVKKHNPFSGIDERAFEK